ncbi:MAG: hypothetical protein ABIW82_15650 [Dokdonella sp.]
MTTWTWITVLFDGAAAIVFLTLGYAVRQWALLEAGFVLIVAIGLLVGATLLQRESRFVEFPAWLLGMCGGLFKGFDPPQNSEPVQVTVSIAIRYGTIR